MPTTFNGATFSGDVTVDSTTFHVDSTNNRVGIGTTNPTSRLEVSGINTAHNTTIYPLTVTTISSSSTAVEEGIGTGIEFRVERRDTDNLQNECGAIRVYGAAGIPSTSDYWNMAFRVKSNDTIFEPMTLKYNGNIGIGTTDPKTRLHVGVGDAILRMGAVDYEGSAENTSTYGLERSRNQILFSTWRDAQTDKIGAKICGINKQTYNSPSNRHLIQSTDLAFYTVPPDAASYDETLERLRITDTGNVGIGTTSPGTKLDVNGTFSATGPTTGANHGSSSTLYLLDTCFFKEWSYTNYVAPTDKVTFNTSTEIPDGAKAVLAEVYLSRDDLTTGDHQIHVLGKNHIGSQTSWRSGAGQPSTAFSADVDVRQTVELLMPGETDGFTHYYGKWHSSVIIPLENNKIYYSNRGNSSSTGWVYVRIRGYYI